MDAPAAPVVVSDELKNSLQYVPFRRDTPVCDSHADLPDYSRVDDANQLVIAPRKKRKQVRVGSFLPVCACF